MTPEQLRRIGLRIRTLRLKKRFSKRELGEMVGVSEGHIQELESGKENVTLDMAVRLGRALNVSLDYLLMGVSSIPGAGDGIVRLRCDTQAQEIKDEPSAEHEKISDKEVQQIYPPAAEKPEKQKKQKVLVINTLEIGNRIREIRLQRGITEAFLAESVHITPSHMSNIEHGKKVPSVEVVVALAQSLDVSIDYIVLGIRPVIGAGNWGLRLHSGDGHD